MAKPRLRVLAGTGTSSADIQLTPIHTGRPVKLVSDLFDGELIVHIKGLEGSHPTSCSKEYFAKPERAGITWSIQVRGRFLQPISADDVLFGNTFDRPLGLPWGSGAALRFMNYIDPTLEHDLTSQTKPWALSPLIATMPHFMHARVPCTEENEHKFLSPPSAHNHDTHINTHIELPPFPPPDPITDDTSQLHLARTDAPSSSNSSSSSRGSAFSDGPSSSTSSLGSMLSVSSSTSYVSAQRGSSPKAAADVLKKMATRVRKGKAKGKSRQERLGLGLENAAQRRAYFSTAAHRRGISFGPEDMITMDFCYGFLEFSPTLALRLPGGITFDLMRYWDGQPVRFVCCERKRGDSEGGGEPWGTVFWCVAIEMGSEDQEEGDTVDTARDCSNWPEKSPKSRDAVSENERISVDEFVLVWAQSRSTDFSLGRPMTEEEYGLAHPAASRPQRTVWLPRDTLGLAEEEERGCRQAGVDVSIQDAQMNGTGKVDISGSPPDLIKEE
ncbi:hypothetical protein D9615_008319 [Tricholomella constricta]|uniref:DUF1769-domain-containing protein n=1 Tax=Tricholomella constricta TaxID=117010 RepID=A0A8H5M5D3_9AGAR|nr:hypothetical protein D9615_008319 [Tricholomella constricta]